MLVAEQYGLLLDFAALAKLLGLEKRTLENQHSAGTLGIPMTKRGGKWVAHYADVADYVDSFRSGASQPSPDRAAYSA
jgi:hypothetical protein